MKAEYFWCGVIGSLTGVDIYLDRRHPHYTLSAVTRRVFRVETKHGKVAFIAVWGGLTFWFVPHILVPVMQEIADWTSEGTWGHDQSAA